MGHYILAFKKGNQYGKLGGRPKGSKNKLTKVRDEFIKVFHDLGGRRAFLQFLKENKIAKREFYLKVIPGMLPRPQDLEGVAKGRVVFVFGDDDGQDNKTTGDATEIHTE